MNICKQGPHLCFAFECQRREAKDQRRNKTILSLLSWPYRWKRELFLRVGSILAFSDYILVFYCYLLRKEPSKRGQYHLCLLFHSFLWMWIHTKTMHACTWLILLFPGRDSVVETDSWRTHQFSYIGQEVGLKLPLMIRRSRLPTHLMYYAVFFYFLWLRISVIENSNSSNNIANCLSHLEHKYRTKQWGHLL